MAHRAAGLDDLDFFPTPPWAARAGGELIRRLDPFARTCWEPACGQGHMVWGLRDYFDAISASDIYDFGQPHVGDFLGPEAAPCGREAAGFDWIVTNPPFVAGGAFVRRAWPLARRGVALLLRLSFLEGAARHRLLYEDCPLSICAPFSERVPMVKGRWDPNASSATAYAWFVWLKPALGLGVANCRLVPIPPRTKARLTRPDDALRFGCAAPIPLLEDT